MSTDLNASFSEQFMNINIKLKKRFMRKPNISEATNEFIALAIQCEHSEQPAFAAHAYVGAAKCEASIGNSLGEAEHYVTAARQFMKAEKKLKSLKFFSPDRENLEASIGCFIQALHKYPEKSPLRVSILSELAEDLVFLGHNAEALEYFEQALEDVTEGTMRLMFLRRKLDLQIDCEKYDLALETANAIADSNLSIPEDILTEIQINRILLTLLVKPSEENKPPSLKQLFAHLMNDTENDLLPFNTDLLLKLQSIVISSMSGDVVALTSGASEARRLISVRQEALLCTLVRRERADRLTFT